MQVLQLIAKAVGVIGIGLIFLALLPLTMAFLLVFVPLAWLAGIPLHFKVREGGRTKVYTVRWFTVSSEVVGSVKEVH